MGCYYTLCHNTYAFSLLFYKVYMKRENAGSWNSGLDAILVIIEEKRPNYAQPGLGAESREFHTLIRPFCIMLLYRYLLHYGLLLHIMSQYLCLFSLILQGLHEEGECRQLESWAGKGANIRDLFCTTPKVLKLHGSTFQNI